MHETKTILIRLVLSKLYDHLHENYSLSQPKKHFLDTHPTQRDIDAVFAFKSDVQLEEFSSAFERIDRGEFGKCQHCESEIPIRELENQPCKRFCSECEKLLKRASLKRPLEKRELQSH